MTEPAGLRWTRVAVLLLCLSEASQTNRNYYEALGVEPAATERQIKRAFRELASRCHPDRNTGAGAEEAFREVAEAYSVLSDPEKRKLYDRSLENVASEDEQETSFHFSFFQDFEEVFTEEPHFHWSFYQDGEDDEGLYDHFSFNRPGFNYFRDEDENEEVNY